MAVSNTSTRPSARAYDISFSWTLSSGKAGTRTVYVWFRDRKGHWSGASKDTITFDNAPTAPGYTWELSQPENTRIYYCNRAWIDFIIPGYAAHDRDGDSTLTVVDAWNGSQHYPVTKTTARVGVFQSLASRTYYSFDFKVKDGYGVTVTGRVGYYIGPCP